MKEQGGKKLCAYQTLWVLRQSKCILKLPNDTVTISNTESIAESKECKDGDLVRICIHKGIIYDPRDRKTSQENVRQMV